MKAEWRKKKIKDFFKILADNITTIVAIFMGVHLCISFREYKIEELLAYIISILTLIAGSMLIEKIFSLFSIKRDLRRIDSKLNDTNVFMYCHSSDFWNEAMNSAKKLFLSGGSLYHVIPERAGDLERLLEQGCEMEVVVVEPYSDALNLLHKNVVKEIDNSNGFSNNTIQTLEFLLKYKRERPNQISIRLNDNVPAFGIFAVYKDSKPKTIQANLFSEKVAYDKRLAILVNDASEKNQFVYEYFCSQIESLRNRLSERTITEIEAIISQKKELQ